MGFVSEAPSPAAHVRAVCRPSADRLEPEAPAQTTAEGVETEAQFHAVAHIGCQYAQGYLFSPPRPATEIPALLMRCAAARSSAVEAAQAQPLVA